MRFKLDFFDSRKVLRLFLSTGMRLVGLGVIIGVALAMATSQLTANWLYGISPFNALHLFGGALFMVAIALAAISVPVFRATRVDPNDALRTE